MDNMCDYILSCEGCSYKGEQMITARVVVLFKAYKENKEVNLSKEESLKDDYGKTYFIDNAFSFSYDPEQLFTFSKNQSVYDKFISERHYDKITAQAVAFILMPKQEIESIDDLISPTWHNITEQEFRDLIKQYPECFDNETNHDAASIPHTAETEVNTI